MLPVLFHAFLPCYGWWNKLHTTILKRHMSPPRHFSAPVHWVEEKLGKELAVTVEREAGFLATL